jgi:T5orf172 domain
MSDKDVPRVPVWQIPRLNPGYIYIIQAGERLKIGKSKDRDSRIRNARTWLPDMTLIGTKPFWNVNDLEKDLHEGLAQWWYEGEWFHPGDDPYLEDFLHNFRAFSDDDAQRDVNSVDFLYWMHDMAEIAMERAYRGQSLRAFQRDVSEAKKNQK